MNNSAVRALFALLGGGSTPSAYVADPNWRQTTDGTYRTTTGGIQRTIIVRTQARVLTNGATRGTTGGIDRTTV